MENKKQTGQPEEQNLLPAVDPRASFAYIRQGPLSNALAKTRFVRAKVKIDKVTSAATLAIGDISLSVSNVVSLEKMRTSTHKFLDALVSKAVEAGMSSSFVVMTLEEYMDMCGLKDRKEARAQVRRDMDALYALSVSFSDGEHDDNSFMDLRICEAKGISKRGVITYRFSQTFFELLSKSPVMPYPRQLWRINPNNNPNSFYFLRRISEHKRMNVGRKGADVIGVNTLLEASPFIPAPSEVTNRHYTNRIKRPFVRDMDELDETLEWNFYDKKGQPVTKTDAIAMDYSEFAMLNVRVKWLEYPDMAGLIKAREKRAKTAAEHGNEKPVKKKPGRPKKTP